MGWLLFFDGDCAFCSCSVRTVARLDQRGRISFAPLQGRLSREMGFDHYAIPGGGSMVILRETDGEIFTYSDGWIKLANALGGVWRVFTLARVIPKSLRDLVYRWVARHRYRFMGKAGACALPDPALAKRLRE